MKALKEDRVLRIRLQSNQVHPTVLTIIQMVKGKALYVCVKEGSHQKGWGKGLQRYRIQMNLLESDRGLMSIYIT